MKKFTVGLFSLLLMATTGFLPAQDMTPITEVSTVAPQGKSGIRGRLRFQALRIRQGLKSGVLSKDQATALMDKLKSIADQAKADFEQNGRKALTHPQKTQINQLLDDNSKAIYQAKHPGQDASGSSSDTVPDDSNDNN